MGNKFGPQDFEEPFALHFQYDRKVRRAPVPLSIRNEASDTVEKDSVDTAESGLSRDLQWTLDAGLKIIAINDMASIAVGCKAPQLQGVEFAGLFSDPVTVRDFYNTALKNGTAQGRFLDLRLPDGGVCRLLCRAVRMKGKMVQVTARDLSHGKCGVAPVLDSAEKYHAAFEYASLGIALTDLDGNFFEVNRIMQQIFGFDKQQLSLMNVCDLAHTADVESIREYFRAVLEGEQGKSFVEARFLDGKGDLLFISVTCGLAMTPAGLPHYRIVSFRDVTERQQTQIKLEEQVAYDSLTRALNRAQMQERCNHEVLRSERHGHKLSLVLIDLDHFKQVNDTCGHAAGDQVLSGFSDLTRDCLRKIDLFGRWGGDEFILLLPETGVIGARRVAERIRVALEAHRFSHGVQVTASLGIAGWRVGESFIGLLERADVLMYRAKQGERNRIEVDSEDLHRDSISKSDHLPMHALQWKRAYASGNAEIDGEHRQLFQLCNRILSAMAVQHDKAKILVLVDALLADVVTHFQNEEKLLTECQYPALEEHQGCHRRLLEQAAYLLTRFKHDDITAGALLGFVIHDVVARHMLQEDFKYQPWIESSHPPAAKSRPRASQSGMA